MKNVVIFGSTGRTGAELVQQALDKGYHVTAFVRDPQKLSIQHPELTHVQGDVLNPGDVDRAVANQDAVLCSIGTSGMDRSFLRTIGTSNILAALEKLHVERLICQSSLGFGDTEAMMPWYVKNLVIPLFLKHAFVDHAAQEELIERSNLDWTIVRPGALTNGDRTGAYKAGFSVSEKIKLRISRADCAEFMISQLTDEQYSHQKVGLSY